MLGESLLKIGTYVTYIKNVCVYILWDSAHNIIWHTILGGDLRSGMWGHLQEHINLRNIIYNSLIVYYLS